MNIQILGTGCAKCDTLYQRTQQAIAELTIDAEIEKVTDLAQIMAMGVMTTPALVIDEQVRLTGKVPSVDEIKQMLS